MGATPSNTAKVTVSDPSGNEYSVKFNSESFASGKHRHCYIGTLFNDKASKHHRKIVFKVWKTQMVDDFQADYQCIRDLERSIVCHQHATAFNKAMSQDSSFTLPFSFPAPLRINIKRTQDPTCTFGADKWASTVFDSIPVQLANHKYLTVQLHLKSNTQYKYQKLSSNNGWIASDYPQNHVVSAFSHFSWAHSKGKKLITGLQGVQRGNKLLISDAVIHSDKVGQNGHHDLGLVGMVNFFMNHECNEYCKHLATLNTTLLMDYLSKPSILNVDKSTSYLFELEQQTLAKDEENMQTAYAESIQFIFDKEKQVNKASVPEATEQIESMVEEQALNRTENAVHNDDFVQEENVSDPDGSDTDSIISDDSVDMDEIKHVGYGEQIEIINHNMDVSWFGAHHNEMYAHHHDVNKEEDACDPQEWELIN
eukprot:314797_1